MKTQSFKLQNVELRRHELCGTIEIRNRGGMKTQSFELQNVELRRHELCGTFEIRNRGSHGGKKCKLGTSKIGT